MKFQITDRNLPYYHLEGTLVGVITLALALGGSFQWIGFSEHQQTIDRLEQSFQVKKQERLKSEMEAAIGYLDFVHSRTESVLQEALQDKVSMAMQTAQAIYDLSIINSCSSRRSGSCTVRSLPRQLTTKH